MCYSTSKVNMRTVSKRCPQIEKLLILNTSYSPNVDAELLLHGKPSVRVVERKSLPFYVNEAPVSFPTRSSAVGWSSGLHRIVNGQLLDRSPSSA